MLLLLFLSSYFLRLTHFDRRSHRPRVETEHAAGGGPGGDFPPSTRRARSYALFDDLGAETSGSRNSRKRLDNVPLPGSAG